MSAAFRFQHVHCIAIQWDASRRAILGLVQSRFEIRSAIVRRSPERAERGEFTSELGIRIAEARVSRLIGQLLFVAAVLLRIALVRRRSLTMPGWARYAAPYAIGTVAMLWVIERVGSFWS